MATVEPIVFTGLLHFAPMDVRHLYGGGIFGKPVILAQTSISPAIGIRFYHLFSVAMFLHDAVYLDVPMKPLLKQYLAWGIVALFVVAAAVDFGGQFFREGFEGSGFRLSPFTIFILSIRHWAFALPMAMLVLTIALYPRARSEGILLHLFGVMMFTAIVIVTILSVAIILPMFAMHGSGGME